MPPLQVLMSFIGIIVVLFGAYYATYYVGLKASGQSRNKTRSRNRNINLLERFSISKDKSFCIVEIAGNIYVVGVTNQSMTVIDTIDAEKYAQMTSRDDGSAAWAGAPGGPFSGKFIKSVASFMGQRMNNSRKPQGSKPDKSDGRETFADSMRAAREKDISEQQSQENTERADGSEEER